MTEMILDHLVEKNKEGSYYALPFQVPEGVVSVTVTYSYPRIARKGDQIINIIDLGLEDSQGQFLGWSGSSRKSVTVGEFTATPGYCMAPVRAGTWHILVGAFHVQENGVPVRYRISFEKREPGWLFGDLHVHSTASDGQYDVLTLARKAKRMNLDFLSVTDHNNYSENYYLPRISGLTLIPGTEWTHYLGHMNIFGLKKPFSGTFIANDPEDMHRIITDAAERGALISVNHPRCNLCPYLWPDDHIFAAMEIWNGPMSEKNRDGIRWWTELLRQGRHIPGLGGSDFHRSFSCVRMGVPVTAVYSASRRSDDILAALAAGHSYITRSINGIRLDMRCGEARFGDTVRKGVVSVSAERMPLGSELQLIGADGVLARFPAKSGQVHVQLSLPETPFVYLMAGYPTALRKGMPLAISNPLYFEKE